MKHTLQWMVVLCITTTLQARQLETAHNRFRLSTVNISSERVVVDSLIALITAHPPIELPPLEPLAAQLNPQTDLDTLVKETKYPFTKGTIPPNFEADCSKALLPTLGHICSNYGSRRGRVHTGVDLKLNLGDTVVAAFDGTVTFARSYMAYGKLVVITHPNGLQTAYSHLSYIDVKVGQRVAAGHCVGLGGRTGRATTTHLHFEVRVKGRPINPSAIFDFKNKTVKTDRYVHRAASPRRTTPVTAAAANGKTAIHTVRSGDTLGKISRAYGSTVEKLCELNALSPTSTLSVGQKIRCTP